MRQRNSSLPETSGQNSKFAPAGYGLGESNGKQVTDPDTVLAVGFYILGGAATENLPDGFRYSVMFVERRYACIYQTFKSADGFSTLLEARRYSVDGGATWSELEYANPPMEIGVEYRTTERWKGKPVYAQLIDFGNLPNATSKQITFSFASEISEVIDWYGYVDHYGICLPFEDEAINVLPTTSGIMIITTTDYSQGRAYIVVKYTKVTS